MDLRAARSRPKWRRHSVASSGYRLSTPAAQAACGSTAHARAESSTYRTRGSSALGQSVGRARSGRAQPAGRRGLCRRDASSCSSGVCRDARSARRWRLLALHGSEPFEESLFAALEMENEVWRRRCHCERGSRSWRSRPEGQLQAGCHLTKIRAGRPSRASTRPTCSLSDGSWVGTATTTRSACL